MRIILFIISLFIFFPFYAENNSFDSVLIQLDKAISESYKYSAKREDRITELKKKSASFNKLSVPNLEANTALYEEYKPYKCDSAILYLNKSIEISEKLKIDESTDKLKLKLANLLASTGMYLESVEVLDGVKRSKVDSALLVEYFQTKNNVYGELAHYTQNPAFSSKYRQTANSYRDSLIAILPVDSKYLLFFQEKNFLYNKKFDEALRINSIQLDKYKIGSPEYAVIAWHRSLIYDRMKDLDSKKYYLAASALSDIVSAKKDHASLWTLAQILYNEGDINRAYNYIRFSWSETIFYNARLRSLQSADILSLIDKTYQATIEAQKSKLQRNLLIILVLSLFLLAASLFIYRQMKRISSVQKRLLIANKELLNLNFEQKELNSKLNYTNAKLSESNYIKEEYIGRFLKLCSTYIEKLNEFRRLVNKKIDTGETIELLSYTKSYDAFDLIFQELYENFDEAFLRIFPDFVTQVNSLFKTEDHIKPKDKELLNTELRILALVRLGIKDSTQIADFLRFSVHTIYNYRAKLRSKALVKENFEYDIMQIN